ncbi:ribosomal protein L17 [Rhizoctonia solani AG-1 IA]|uniref:Ribosomal protein L17 n=2 Tax=Rhizoctonia solani TaxID=456999 RepID=A0A8H7LMS6_9AGAM
MKHGIAFRKLSRTSSHRNLMLRNLVSSLLQHEQIMTTVAKAKETARLAEKVITLAKKGTLPARQDAEGFLLNPHSILDKLFTTYRDRYLQRPGGYTRILKYGHRQGDHAPKAILQLVDGPRDLRLQMAGRAVGRETAGSFAVNEPGRGLRERTKWAVDKALKFSGDEGKKRLEAVAQEHANKLLAEPRAFSGLLDRSLPVSETGKRKIRAGERLTGMSTSATGLGIAKGALGKKPSAKIPGFWQRGWQQKVGLPAPSA